MDTDRAAASLRVFNVLLTGSIIDREAVFERLNTKDPSLDLSFLRGLIWKALHGEYTAEKVSGHSSSDKAWTRCWLLSSLGRVAEADSETITYLKAQTLADNEPNDWARYWALESLITTGVEPLEPTAAGVVAASKKKNEKLAARLAAAYLAAHGHNDQLDVLITGIKNEDWTCLRALRVMPVEETVPALCDIVRQSQFTDATYDSIVALGSLPKDWSVTEKAADALISCIKETRRHPWWDGLRRKAIRALGNLVSREATPIFIDELAAGDPSIVYEAARALERTVGVKVAAARIVEAAVFGGSEELLQYANALRWMNRTKIVEELEAIMSEGPQAQREVARDLLSEVGGRIAFDKLRARTGAMKHHMALLESTEKGIREMFDSSINEARTGYKLATIMDAIVFLVGIGLLGIAAYQITTGKLELAAFTGTGGALGVIYNLFFSNPRKRVQESVEHLLSLKVVFLGYLRQLHQADRAFLSRFIEESSITPAVVSEFSQLIGETMQGAITHIQQLKGGGKRKKATPNQNSAESPPNSTGSGKTADVEAQSA
jgi:HEAT repeat protein